MAIEAEMIMAAFIVLLIAASVIFAKLIIKRTEDANRALEHQMHELKKKFEDLENLSLSLLEKNRTLSNNFSELYLRSLEEYR